MALQLQHCAHMQQASHRFTQRRPSTRRVQQHCRLSQSRSAVAVNHGWGLQQARQSPNGSRNIQTFASLEEAPLQPVYTQGELTQYPDAPGVYAIYNDKDEIQYIGVSRRISMSVAGHLQDQAQYTHAIKYSIVESGTREALTEEWKSWLEAAVAATNNVPPGNEPGNTVWQRRAKPPKPEVRLTAGKGITGITIEDLLDQVVKACKVVAFIKGKRLQPQCGFSYKMLNILNDTKVDYEVVDVLDEFHNPGLREAIKVYSQWPTIPQLYVNGEFVGGADIVEQMQQSGELEKVLAAAKS